MASLFKSLKNRLLAAALLVFGVLGFLFGHFIDLNPRVTSDFFFGSDDPEIARSAQIQEIFPSDEFLIISVAGEDIFSGYYHDRLARFSQSLGHVRGISRVISATDGPATIRAAAESPFWRPLLISGDEEATLIIAFVVSESPPDMIGAVEAVARQFDDGDAFQIRISGMPYIAEQIGRGLAGDFMLFSGSAMILFAMLQFIVFRSAMIMLGAAIAGVTAIFLTLLVMRLLGLPSGILIANLATIVFVLVQSQIIYLTANWRRQQGTGELNVVRESLRETFRASFWCMVTTLLGFVALLSVPAEPLRQLGAGGIIGAVATLLCAFLIYPVFLLFVKGRKDGPPASGRTSIAGVHKSVKIVIAVALLGIAGTALPGLLRVDTDPGLLSYFREGSELGQGLAYIDANGGSSPLELVVRRQHGERLDNDAGYEAMWRLHNDLSVERDVGTVISLPTLLAEANSHPLAFLLPWREIVSLLSLDLNGRVVESFLNTDRDQTLFLLRMKEAGREETRLAVTARLQEVAKSNGFDVVLIGGVYQLQGRLADLIGRSIVTGLAMITLLFAIIAWIVSRNLGTALAMTVTAGLIPVVILGGAGWLRVPLDIISAPASSVCFGIAVDALIHLAAALRRHGFPNVKGTAIHAAIREQAGGVIASTGIIAVGFLIFATSAFPPTARFGMAVVIGALFAGIAALTLFPLLARMFLSGIKSE